jgi:hypothetical protein
MKTRFLLVVYMLCISLLGCQSRFVALTIQNQGTTTLKEVEVDYPSGPPSEGFQSFGVDRLDPGKEFHYKFKPTGAGSLKLSFLDEAGKKHAEIGPAVRPGGGGQVVLAIDATGLKRPNPSPAGN